MASRIPVVYDINVFLLLKDIINVICMYLMHEQIIHEINLEYMLLFPESNFFARIIFLILLK